MVNNPAAGGGQPYWYEWSVGLDYVLDMLHDDSPIASITFQSVGIKGLDDVVVRFRTGPSHHIQVKHSSAGDTLTFGDLVAPEGSRPPLLQKMADAWRVEHAQLPAGCIPRLVTNRAFGTRSVPSRATPPVRRPVLQDFLVHLAAELGRIANFADLQLPEEWRPAWIREWLPCLINLTDPERYLFLKSLQVNAGADDLDALTLRLLGKIGTLFGVPPDAARGLLAHLHSALVKWATPFKAAAVVDREEVYDALCLVADRPTGNHDLPPPAPFLPSRLVFTERLHSLLSQRANPIVFLCGEPGSGKTALLSHMANRRTPTIDLRFYAYRPITPTEQILSLDVALTTTARVLWTDLLLQLRRIAHGSLSQLRVPVHAGSLSPDALRQHTLRIADAIGADRGHPIVIAIDGIDHVARAGGHVSDFLRSMVAPESVPAHVVFLIGGQPPEVYNNYPAWLRSAHSGVTHVNLPQLTFDDTRALVAERLAATELDLQSNIATDIWQRCQGHTLSTVFAVEHALLNAHALHDLPAILDRSGISAGIEAYYLQIWTAATRGLETPQGAVRLASCLALLPRRAASDAVRAVLGDALLPAPAATDRLRQLRPLVVEDEGGFRVFHNDVRVFLHRLVASDPSVYQECASRLADYLRDGDDIPARYAALQSLLGIAGRRADQARLFTDSYVIECYAAGQPTEDLARAGLVAAEALVEGPPDWTLAQQLVRGLLTLEQLHKSAFERPNEAPVAADTEWIGVQPSERCVTQRSQWNSAVIDGALQDVLRLHQAGAPDRASALFRRWFGGLTPADLHAVVPESEGGLARDGHLLKEFGAVGAHTACFLEVELSVNKEHVEADYASGLLRQVSQLLPVRRALAALRRVQRFYIRDASVALADLVKRRSWLPALYLVHRLVGVSTSNPGVGVRAAAAALAAGRIDIFKHIVDSAVLASVETLTTILKNSQSHDGNVETLIWIAFVRGGNHPYREAGAIREELTDIYHAMPRDERTDLNVSQILYACAMLGSWVRTIATENSTPAHVSAVTVALTVERLLLLTSDPAHALDPTCVLMGPYIVAGLLDCGRTDAAIWDSLRAMLRRVLATNRWLAGNLSAVWNALADSDAPVLVAYAEGWLQPRGAVWHEGASERRVMVLELCRLLGAIGEGSRGEVARQKLPWLDVGFASHKEYVLHAPLRWFRLAADIDDQNWSLHAARLAAISRHVSDHGDNRLAYQVDEAILSAAGSHGPGWFVAVLASELSGIAPEDYVVVPALTSVMTAANLRPSEALAAWAFGTGQLSVYARQQRPRLAELRDRLLRAVADNNRALVSARMAALAPAEFASELAENDNVEQPVTPLWLHDANAIAAVHQACDEADWSSLQKALHRLRLERPQGTASAAERVLVVLGARQEKAWRYDGVDRVYSELLPLLSADRRWELVSRAVHQDHSITPLYRCQSIAEALDDLCLAVAAIDPTLLAPSRQLAELLGTMELWITGAGRLAPMPKPSISAASTLSTWPEALLDVAVDLVARDEQAHVQGALRGIRRMLELDGALAARLAQRIREATPSVQRRILMGADGFVKYGDPHVWLALLSDLLELPRLDLRLMAWQSIRSCSRWHGTVAVEWPSGPCKGAMLLPAGPGLLDRPSSRHGLIQSTGRVSLAIIAMLEQACGDVLDDVSQAFASSVRNEPPSVHRPRRVRRGTGDLVYNPEDESELDRLFVFLDGLERKGRFRDTPIERLAQAAMPFADPDVFLREPRVFGEAALCPGNDELDALVSGSQQGKLLDLLNVGLDASIVVMAGTVHAHSRAWEVRMQLEWVPRVRAGRANMDAVLNGRAAMAYLDPGLVIRVNSERGLGGFFLPTVGTMPFVGGVLDFWPDPVLCDRVGWSVSRDDPLAWERDGKRVAWFERVWTAPRGRWSNDLTWRQPTITRWVCESEEWERVRSLLGGWERRTRSEIAPITGER